MSCTLYLYNKVKQVGAFCNDVRLYGYTTPWHRETRGAPELALAAPPGSVAGFNFRRSGFRASAGPCWIVD